MFSQNAAGNDSQQRQSLVIGSNGEVMLTCDRPPFENLIMEGGGAKGVAYIGSLEVLENNNQMANLKRVGGSSAGGLTAIFVALGCSSSECEKYIKEMDIKKMLDATSSGKELSKKLGVSGGGIMDGRNFYNFLKELILKRVDEIIEKYLDALEKQQDKPNGKSLRKKNRDELLKKIGCTDIDEPDFEFTFKKLETLNKACSDEKIFPDKNSRPNINFKELYITGANVTDENNPKLDVFNASTTPDMEIAAAGRITSSIPGLYKNCVYNGKKYKDAGVLDNFPMRIFDGEEYKPKSHPYSSTEQLQTKNLANGVDANEKANLATLGLSVTPQSYIDELSIKPEPIHLLNHPIDFIFKQLTNAIGDLVTGVSYAENLEKAAHRKQILYPQRIVPIPDQGISMVDFSLSPEDRQKLIDSGCRSTKDWLDNHSGEQILISYADSFSAMIKKLSIDDLILLKENLILDKVNIQLPDNLKDIDLKKETKNDFINLIEKQIIEIKLAETPEDDGGRITPRR